MVKIFMENDNGDMVRIVERKKKGDVIMTVIPANAGGIKKTWYSNDSRLLALEMEKKGFKVVEVVA